MFEAALWHAKSPRDIIPSYGKSIYVGSNGDRKEFYGRTRLRHLQPSS